MSAIDTKKIWATLMNDPGFTARMPVEAGPVMRENLENLPAVLAPYLGQPVTLKSLMEAQSAVAAHEIESGFVAKLTAALPEELLPFPRARMNAMAVKGLTMMVALMREAASDPDAFLQQQGIDERTFLGHPKGGRLDASALKAYDADALTIQGLLELQPALFVQFNRD